MASKDQLRKVAIYCDEYNSKIHDEEVSLKNIAQAEYISCTNCSHFTRDGRCDLNLIDEILSSLAMEEDLKS